MIRWIASWMFLAVAGAASAGGNRLTSALVIDAPRADVWKALTTKDGAQAWMVAHADIDLKVGGLMRTHYDPKGKLGDGGSIENTILSFDPERMLSIKNTKAPKNFPFKKAIQNMWTVIYLEDAGTGKTKVSVIGVGYTEDEESQKLRAFFQRGNELTLQRLQKYFAKKEK
jgi:uncharacterized protein YndB with AHSA1/START domain